MKWKTIEKSVEKKIKHQYVEIPSGWYLFEGKYEGKIESKRGEVKSKNGVVTFFNGEGSHTIQCVIQHTSNCFDVSMRRLGRGQQPEWYEDSWEFFDDLEPALHYAVGLMYQKRAGYEKR